MAETWKRVAAIAAVVLIANSLAAADTVVFKNGDCVTGTVKALEAGRLTVETVHFGTVEVDFAEVASLTIDGQRAVTVRGGTRVVGTLRLEAGGQAAVSTEAGPWSLPAGDVLAIGPAEPAQPEPVKWHGSFEIGVSGQTGNTETFRGNARLNLKRETPDLLITGYASGRYAEEDGETSENVQRAGARQESALGPASFWYSGIDLERDEFKDLELRTTANVGLGRTWWKEDGNYWKTRAGVGFTHESFRDGEDDIFPAAELVGDYGKKINSGLTFTDTVKLIPNLDEIKGWRGLNDAALAVDLSENGDWQLKLGILNEYDNDPPDDVERLDTFYYLNAVRNF